MTNHNDNGKARGNEAGQEVLAPVGALSDQSLAVDLARADIDTAIATAHKYPRSLETVIKKIETMACYNEAAAENSIYSLPRGGKPIIGPSIGFANIVAASWGNCTDAARIVHVDRKDKVVIAEGGFHDLETNRKTVLPVQRRIVDKQGRLFSDDMIMVTGMAAASIARRNAILNAVPRALWFPIYERALQIVRGDIETFAERKDKALKAFAQFGVKPEQVYMALGLKGDAEMTLEHVAPMRGMYSALRDGFMTVEEMFDPRRMTGTGFEKVDNPLGDETGPAETVNKETGEITTAPAKPKKTRGRPKEAKAVTGPELVTGAMVSAGVPFKNPNNRVSPAELERSLQPADTTGGGPAGSRLMGPNVGGVSTVDQPADTTVGGPATKDAAGYKAHLAGWLAFYVSPEKIEQRWRAERDMRGSCGVIEESFAEAKAMKDTRIADLNT
jgi:hypothetical protein